MPEAKSTIIYIPFGPKAQEYIKSALGENPNDQIGVIRQTGVQAKVTTEKSVDAFVVEKSEADFAKFRTTFLSAFKAASLKWGSKPEEAYMKSFYENLEQPEIFHCHLGLGPKTTEFVKSHLGNLVTVEGTYEGTTLNKITILIDTAKLSLEEKKKLAAFYDDFIKEKTLGETDPLKILPNFGSEMVNLIVLCKSIKDELATPQFEQVAFPETPKNISVSSNSALTPAQAKSLADALKAKKITQAQVIFDYSKSTSSLYILIPGYRSIHVSIGETKSLAQALSKMVASIKNGEGRKKIADSLKATKAPETDVTLLLQKEPGISISPEWAHDLKNMIAQANIKSAEIMIAFASSPLGVTASLKITNKTNQKSIVINQSRATASEALTLISDAKILHQIVSISDSTEAPEPAEKDSPSPFTPNADQQALAKRLYASLTGSIVGRNKHNGFTMTLSFSAQINRAGKIEGTPLIAIEVLDHIPAEIRDSIDARAKHIIAMQLKSQKFDVSSIDFGKQETSIINVDAMKLVFTTNK